MAAFFRLPRRILPVWRVTVFGGVMGAVLVGLALPSAMAVYGLGGFGRGGFSAAGRAAPRPAPTYRPPANNYAPKRPLPPKTAQQKTTQQKTAQQKTTQQKTAHQNRVPPKHSPQPRGLAQTFESHQDSFSPSSQATYDSPGNHTQPSLIASHRESSPKSLTPAAHVSTPNSRWSHSLSTSTDKPRREKSFTRSRSIASYHEHPHYLERRHHHHYWDHAWWYDNDYYYDGYWYAANPYFNYDEMWRQMAINSIREQIGAAEEVLDSAVPRQEMLEDERQAAQKRIADARDTIKSAVDDQHDSSKTMREIQDRLTAQQGPHSELVEAQAKVAAARAAIDREVHRVLGLPSHTGTPAAADYAHEVAMLTSDQHAQLNQDSQFREATEKLRAAAQEVARVAQALFEKDADWVKARKAAVKAKQEQAEADRQLGKDTGVGQLGNKLELHSLQDVVEQARAVIATGRAALRILGATAPPSSANDQPQPSDAS